MGNTAIIINIPHYAALGAHHTLKQQLIYATKPRVDKSWLIRVRTENISPHARANTYFK